MIAGSVDQPLSITLRRAARRTIEVATRTALLP